MTAAASIVSLVVLSAYKDSILSGGDEKIVAMDRCWRFLIGLGCVPGVVALYFRLTVPETPRFTMDVVRDIKLAVRNIQAVLSANGVQPGIWEVDQSHRVRPSSPVDAPRSSWSDFKEYFGKWENLRVLIGCSYSWFALDVRVLQMYELRHAYRRAGCLLRPWPQHFQSSHFWLIISHWHPEQPALLLSNFQYHLQHHSLYLAYLWDKSHSGLLGHFSLGGSLGAKAHTADGLRGAVRSLPYNGQALLSVHGKES